MGVNSLGVNSLDMWGVSNRDLTYWWQPDLERRRRFFVFELGIPFSRGKLNAGHHGLVRFQGTSLRTLVLCRPPLKYWDGGPQCIVSNQGRGLRARPLSSMNGYCP